MDAQGMAFDAAGNLYLSDSFNHRIRKVDAATGTITTIAGTGEFGFSGDGGPAASSRLCRPWGLAFNSSGDLFVGDECNLRVRKISASNGVITTVAGSGVRGDSGDGSPATAARFQDVYGIAIDSHDNLYVTDTGNHRLKRVDAATGIISTVAGTGVLGSYGNDGVPAITARLCNPVSVAVDGQDNVYLVDNNGLHKIDASSGLISRMMGSFGGFSGEGELSTAAGGLPTCVAFGRDNALYLCDQYSKRVRKILLSTGRIYTVAGNGYLAQSGFEGDGGIATAAHFWFLTNIAVDSGGNVYASDYASGGYTPETRFGRIRRVSPPVPTYRITTIAGTGSAGFNGDGSATSAQLSSPQSTAVDALGNVYVADTNNHRIRKLAPTGVLATIAGTGVAGFSGDGGAATDARLNYPQGICVDAAGNIFVADAYNFRVRRISTTGTIDTVAGSAAYGFGGDGGPATQASLSLPAAVAVDGAGNLFIADTYNHRIRKVSAATATITTVVGTGTPGLSGDGGAASASQLNSPQGVIVNATGDLFISDTENSRVRRVSSSNGVISTFAGSANLGVLAENAPATSGYVWKPTGLAIDTIGNVFIAATRDNLIRRVDAASGIITTIAGSGGDYYGGTGGDGGVATAGQFYFPYGVSVDSIGNLWVADTSNHRVRKITVPLVPPSQLRLMRYGKTGVILTWSSVPGASSYVIKRGTTAGAATPAATVTTNTAYLTGTVGSRQYFQVSALFGNDESSGTAEASIVITTAAARSDIDGDGKSDVTVYRPTNGYWFSRNSTTGYAPGNGTTIKWGAVGDIPMQADFDGDGRLDPTVYRPSVGQWFALLSSRNYDQAQYQFFAWGLPTDTPFTADFDGDGSTDIAVYRPESGDWYIRLSSAAYQPGVGTPTFVHWGAAGDAPLIGDFDADGKADVAVYRSGSWFILNSSFAYDTTRYDSFAWGATGDVPVVADFDGDARADIGVYRPSNGYWYLRLSSAYYAVGNGNWIFQWGAPGDEPKLGDFDGDGLVDITVYRPSTGQWFIRYSSFGYDPAQFGYFQWAATGDIALP